jgi:transposase
MFRSQGGKELMRRTGMLKAKEILRLKYAAELSLRDIAKAVSCGKSTVAEVLERANSSGIFWPVSLSDKQLISLLYPPAQNRDTFPEPDMENVFYEMKKKGVTLMLLWEEYKEASPEGIMYTQFCERYRSFKKACRLTMHIEHKAGQEMQVDLSRTSIKICGHRNRRDKERIYICYSSSCKCLSLCLCIS